MTDNLPGSPEPTDESALPLHSDPELAARLEFEPVPRKVKRHDMWTPELQREFIRRLAASGSPQRACVEMGKSGTGIEALYKNPVADSFRAAWDLAVQIGRQARGIGSGPPHLGAVPGIQRRADQAANRAASAARAGEEPEITMGDDEKLGFLDSIVHKFMAKVRQEREARLAGEVVAADFFLRQVTCLEVMFDLMARGFDTDPLRALMQVREDRHGMLETADTPISRMLDAARRQQWIEIGEPIRPEGVPDKYLLSDGDDRLEPAQALGRASRPLPGVDPDEWRAMDPDEQKRIFEEQCRAAAAAQIAWEQRSAEAKPNDDE